MIVNLNRIVGLGGRWQALAGAVQFSFGPFAPYVAREEDWSPIVVAAAIGMGRAASALVAAHRRAPGSRQRAHGCNDRQFPPSLSA